MGPTRFLKRALHCLVASVFLRQFLSPSDTRSCRPPHWFRWRSSDIKDALFIGAVLPLNGIIGTAQEYSAGRAAAALRKLEQPHASVIRDGASRRSTRASSCPDDLVLLEAGGRVPADLRLVDSLDLQCDESLLTGESLPVKKQRCRTRLKASWTNGGSMALRGINGHAWTRRAES